MPYNKGEIRHQLMGLELIFLQRILTELQLESKEFSPWKKQTRISVSLIPIFPRSNIGRETESELSPGDGQLIIWCAFHVYSLPCSTLIAQLCLEFQINIGLHIERISRWHQPCFSIVAMGRLLQYVYEMGQRPSAADGRGKLSAHNTSKPISENS